MSARLLRILDIRTDPANDRDLVVRDPWTLDLKRRPVWSEPTG